MSVDPPFLTHREEHREGTALFPAHIVRSTAIGPGEEKREMEQTWEGEGGEGGAVPHRHHEGRRRPRERVRNRMSEGTLTLFICKMVTELRLGLLGLGLFRGGPYSVPAS